MSDPTRDAFREIARLRTALIEANQIVEALWNGDDDRRAELPETAWTIRLSNVLRDGLAPRKAAA